MQNTQQLVQSWHGRQMMKSVNPEMRDDGEIDLIGIGLVFGDFGTEGQRVA